MKALIAFASACLSISLIAMASDLPHPPLQWVLALDAFTACAVAILVLLP